MDQAQSPFSNLKTDIYKHKKSHFIEKEKELIKDFSCNEIFENFKDRCNIW
jgi:hypothetical protein